MVSKTAERRPTRRHPVRKTCRTCRRRRVLAAFRTHKKRGRQDQCIDCRAAYNREHYKANKAAYIDRAREARHAVAQDVLIFKSRTVCYDCRRTYPHYVMEFDHREGEVKIAPVSHLISKGLKAVLEEMKKCDLVCANCHRIRTWERGQQRGRRKS